MTIKFLEDDADGFLKGTRWKGKKTDAVKAAIAQLDVEYCKAQKSWVLRDDKTGLELPLTRDDLAVAGAAILCGSKTWYSMWRNRILYDLLHADRRLNRFRWVL